MRDRSRPRNTLGDLADPALIAQLTSWLEASGAGELEIETADGQSVAIVLGAQQAAVRSPLAALSINAPFAGRFRVQADLVFPGDVQASAMLGHIVVGPLRLPVTAPAAGRISACTAEPDELCGYGAPLFTLEPLA
ncbi:hypothetical protein [Allorhizobium undicola]|uniref:hypothetical protein n=1 Tax=Allorhizobium undicola TaxID=78527 RepID=UPI000487F390|nr:hypothetical protein [Allorhizobium undicola]